MSQDQDNKYFISGLLPGILFVLVMWLVFLAEGLLGTKLSFLGVLPRTAEGLAGILFSPLIHADLEHLLSNTFPFLVLSGVIFYAYSSIAGKAMAWIYFTAGFWLWCFGRGETHHIGASGIIYGMAGFVFFMGIFRKNRSSLALSMLVILLYSGLLAGIFPRETRVSWEGHLTGMLAGAVVAFSYRREVPKTEQKTYYYLEQEDPYLDYLATEVYNPEKKSASHENRPKSFKSLKINYIVVPGAGNKKAGQDKRSRKRR